MIINGTSGNDTLTSSTSADTINGGLGNDVYQFESTGGTDVITDSGGFDTLSFNFTNNLLKTLKRLNNNLVVSYGTSNTVTVNDFFPTNAGVGKVEAIKFSDGISREMIFGNSTADSMFLNGIGISLNGTYRSTTGAEVGYFLAGLEGDDSYWIDSSNDIVFENAGEGFDTVYLNNNYTGSYTAADNVERVLGGTASTTFNSGTGQHEFRGAGGNDTYNIFDQNAIVADVDVGDVINVYTDNFDVKNGFAGTVNYLNGAKALVGFIDAGLTGVRIRDTLIGQSTVVTYSFDDSNSRNTSGFLAFTPAQKAAIASMLSQLSATIGVTFVQATTGNSSFINFTRGTFTDLGKGGTTFADGITNYANVTLTNEASFDDISIGSQAYSALVHEVGHALGLEHSNALSGVTMNSDLSIMPTVNEYNQHPTGWYKSDFGTYDLSSLHYLYGVTNGYKSSGAVTANAAYANDQTYYLKNHYNNRIDRYIADGTGTDIVSAANETQNVFIDLTPGSWIYSGTKSQNILDDGQAFIGFGTYIENAVGGSGNDTLTGNALGNNLNGGSGNDSISGGDGSDILKGSLGTDTLDGGVGSDWADYRGTSLAVTVNLATTTAQNTGGWGTDTLVNIENVFGGLGNDSLMGNALGNTIRGGLGNDFMDGLAGGDYVDYRDITTVGLTIDLSLTTAQITGAGTDTILNFESIYSGAANDRLTGNNLANQLLAYAGNDTLSGGLGNDGLQGGVGNDTYLFQRGAGADTLTEADATAGNSDLLWFDTNVTSSQLWFQHTGNNLVVSVIGTSDKVTLSNWYTGSANQVETIKASDGKTLSNAKVDALVSAMSVFAIPAAGTTTLPTSYQTSLNPVLAANWV